MSHVAEALRRHQRERALAAQGAPDVALEGADSQPWSVPANPWNIVDAPASPYQTLPPIGTASVGAERAPQITGIRSRGLLDLGHASREQFAPIVQCLLHDGPADTRIRSLLFIAIAPEHSASLCAVNAVRIYVANLMTEPGETDGYTLDAHLRAIRVHTGLDLFDYILVNETPVDPGAVARYSTQGSLPVVSTGPLEWAGRAQVVRCDLTPDYSGEKIRHQPRAVARAIRAVIAAGRT